MKLLQTQKQQRLQLARDPVYHAYHAAEKQRMIKLKKKGWTEPVKPQVHVPPVYACRGNDYPSESLELRERYNILQQRTWKKYVGG